MKAWWTVPFGAAIGATLGFLLVSLASQVYQTHWGTSGVLQPGEAVVYIVAWVAVAAAGGYAGLRVARRHTA